MCIMISGGAGWPAPFWKKPFERAPDLEITALVGLIFAHNEPSIRLFEQLGFSRWGYLPGIAQMDDQMRDLTIMGRHVGGV